MSDDHSSDRKERIAVYKKIIVALVIFLLVFPSIVSIILLVRQAEMQKEIDNLARELANIRLGTISDAGRLGGSGTGVSKTRGRIVDDAPELAMYFPEYFDPDKENGSAGKGELSGKEMVADASEKGSDGPDVYTGDVVWSFSAEGKTEDAPHKVYLTFDDGPSGYTDEILDILDSYGVKATFFVVGKETDSDIELYKRIVEEGHTLGMHSYSHVYSEIYSSEEAFERDLDSITGLLYDSTGVSPRFYRFPGGSSNEVSKVDMHRFIDILEERGLSYFDWNVASGDAISGMLTPEQILLNSTGGIENRETSVILLHDSTSRPTTVEALPQIIEKIMSMDGTEILPITSDTDPVRHIER